MNSVRRLVSGHKQRLVVEAGGQDLDLVVMTDNIVLMGYPATGFESLYRNQRAHVLRFLQDHYPNYHILNLCPRNENAYSADYFGGPSRVARSPWPDHNPPPLSLLSLLVHRAKRIHKEGKTIVVHCKAGKGRSGTAAISILLATPGLPSPPSKHRSPGFDSLPPSPSEHCTTEEKLEYLLSFHKAARMSATTKSMGVSIASQRRFLRYYGRVLDGHDPRDLVEGKMIRLEWVKVRAKGLKGVLKVLGGDRVAVQVMRYRDTLVRDLRERELALAKLPPETGEEFDDDHWDDEAEMIVPVGTLSASLPPTPRSSTSSSPASSRSPSSLALSNLSLSDNTTQKPAMNQPLNSPSAMVHFLRPSASHINPSGERTTPSPQGSAASSIPPSPSTPTSSTSSINQRGGSKKEKEVESLLDPSREVQLKLLLGKKGSKHSKLPAMAALGVIWFIPSFEADMSTDPPEPAIDDTDDGSNSERSAQLPHRRTYRRVFGKKEVDFLKPQLGLEEVEVAWSWA